MKTLVVKYIMCTGSENSEGFFQTVNTLSSIVYKFCVEKTTRRATEYKNFRRTGERDPLEKNYYT